jgi:hypothetical protein
VGYERRHTRVARTGAVARGSWLLLALVACACGDGSTPSSPSVERVSGVWMSHATLTSVSGGACVGTALQASIGNRDIFAALIQQSNTSLNRNGQRVPRRAEPVVMSGRVCDRFPLDGSGLPGYVDGNIVIPEEVNPFCEKCGWF